MVTRKNFEGRGIGSALIARALEMARIRRCYKVILDCKEHLVAFYEKSGFRPCETCMRIDL